MNITSVQYTNDINGNQNGIKAVVDNTVVFVPLDPANRHYQAILEWVADGNTIEDAD